MYQAYDQKWETGNSGESHRNFGGKPGAATGHQRAQTIVKQANGRPAVDSKPKISTSSSDWRIPAEGQVKRDKMGGSRDPEPAVSQPKQVARDTSHEQKREPVKSLKPPPNAILSAPRSVPEPVTKASSWAALFAQRTADAGTQKAANSEFKGSTGSGSLASQRSPSGVPRDTEPELSNPPVMSRASLSGKTPVEATDTPGPCSGSITPSSSPGIGNGSGGQSSVQDARASLPERPMVSGRAKRVQPSHGPSRQDRGSEKLRDDPGSKPKSLQQPRGKVKRTENSSGAEKPVCSDSGKVAAHSPVSAWATPLAKDGFLARTPVSAGANSPALAGPPSAPATAPPVSPTFSSPLVAAVAPAGASAAIDYASTSAAACASSQATLAAASLPWAGVAAPAVPVSPPAAPQQQQQRPQEQLLDHATAPTSQQESPALHPLLSFLAPEPWERSLRASLLPAGQGVVPQREPQQKEDPQRHNAVAGKPKKQGEGCGPPPAAAGAGAPPSPLQASTSLPPTGLVNSGNTCFLNATVQALLRCPPFLHLLLELRGVPSHKMGADHPTLSAFGTLLSDLHPAPPTPSPPLPPPASHAAPAARAGPLAADAAPIPPRPSSSSLFVHRSHIRPITPPPSFSPLLRKFSPQFHRPKGHGRQEDAQEFLSFLLDEMHEELQRLTSQLKKQQEEEGGGGVSDGRMASSPRHGAYATSQAADGAGDEEEEWETIGPKNMKAVTRTHSVAWSAVADVFRGEMHSMVKAAGAKASATVQPFFLLPLDILPPSVSTVQEALRLLASPESLEGYRPAGKQGSVSVSARKSLKLKSLPRVLVLHLKRFTFGPLGSTKVAKPVAFPLTLTLGRELLSSSSVTRAEDRSFRLISTVVHHGKCSTAGHYTADVRQHDKDQWLRFDDANVYAVPTHKVLSEPAYLLFYQRADL